MDNFGIRILVLDDDQFILKLLVRMLANLGYTSVSTCDSGQAALASIDSPQGAPDLILLDLNMPEMDGLEFVRHLLDRQYNGSLILVSGEDERMQQAAEKLARGHKITVLGHLHKPVSPEGLAKLLGNWSASTPNEAQAEMKIYDADELRQGIASGELVNYYQPKVLMSTGRVVGVEALVRWRHPQDGIVLPEQFISVAENHGLIDELTRVVLTNAFAQAMLWQQSGLNLHMAVNLSMQSMTSLEFPDMIAAIAAKAGLPPQMVELEVTESWLMADLRTPLEILSRLRLKRFRISIDDFGIGNSSLAQLRDLPFDELKIDHTFVHGACSNENLRAMFNASLDLAKKLELGVVAEGVEDREDWDFVARRGCDIAQGYFIARPMPGADLLAWVQSCHQLFNPDKDRQFS